MIGVRVALTNENVFPITGRCPVRLMASLASSDRSVSFSDVTDQAARGTRTSGLDLHLGHLGRNVRVGLMDAFREAIRTGRLAPGTRLPSSRVLATDLGLGRNTVVRVYSELISEGWLTGLHGSGTEVSQRSADL